MGQYIEVVNIKGNWAGGSDTAYPKALLIDLEQAKPFLITEGAGWGLTGDNFTLLELFLEDVMTIFDREESRDVYSKLLSGIENKADSHTVAKEIVASLELEEAS